MNILLLCGITQAGKSTTLRRSIKFLNVPNRIKNKFRKSVQNPPKQIIVNGKIMYIWLCSPQEMTSSPIKAKLYLRKKIQHANSKNADLLVIAFNVSKGHDSKTNACLGEIDSGGNKPNSYFAYLDSNTSLDIFARNKMKTLTTNGYNVLSTIKRSTPEKQGKKFASYIMKLL